MKWKSKSEIKDTRCHPDKWQNNAKEEKNEKDGNQKSPAKILDWVVKSMEFEKEPVSMSRLNFKQTIQ